MNTSMYNLDCDYLSLTFLSRQQLYIIVVGMSDKLHYLVTFYARSGCFRLTPAGNEHHAASHSLFPQWDGVENQKSEKTPELRT